MLTKSAFIKVLVLYYLLIFKELSNKNYNKNKSQIWVVNKH